MALVLTIGHPPHPIAKFIALLVANGADPVVDVPTVPRSRHNPQFNASALAPALAEAGIGYLSMRALGGLRHRRKDAPPSANLLWRQPSFRNFADYALNAMAKQPARAAPSSSSGFVPGACSKRDPNE